MEVVVRLFANLQKYRLGQDRVELEDGTTVEDFLRRTGIPLSEVAIVLVNGKHANSEQPLSDGETLSLFPPIAGG